MKWREILAVLVVFLSCTSEALALEPSEPQVFPPIQQRILAIIYDTHLDHPGRPYWNPAELNALLVTRIEQGSVEKGYLQSARPHYGNHSPNVDLQMVEVIVHNTPSPLKPGQTGSGAADYHRIFDDHGICQRVNQGDIDEVWLWADRDGGYWEATMLGPNDPTQIFDTNSLPIERPDCNRGVHVMGFNYERYRDDGINYQIPEVSSALESFAHRAENTLARFLDGKTRYTVTDGDTYFEFEGQNGYSYDSNGNPVPPRMKGYAGNAHFPPNGTRHYDFYNTTPVLADYLDWTPQHVNPRTLISCTQWNCFKEPYFLQWLQNMPGRCIGWNMTKVNGQPMPNWWAILFKSQIVDPTAPCAPLPPVLTLTKAGGSATLNWSLPAGTGITSYQVERCAGGGCTAFSPIATTPNRTYTEAVATPYRYRVRAFNGSWSAYSNVVDAYLPAAPNGFLIQGSTSLSWWPVPASIYLVERCLGASCSSFTQIAATPSTSYLDSEAASASDRNTVYRYRVRAYDGLYSPYTMVLNSLAAWSGIEVRAICKGGMVSSAATSARVALWPPLPLTFRTDPPEPGAHLVRRIESRDSNSFVYLGLISPAGEWLVPFGTPPHSAMEYGTFFNPPTPMVKWNRNQLPAGDGVSYTVDFAATPAMCAVYTEEEAK